MINRTYGMRRLWWQIIVGLLSGMFLAGCASIPPTAAWEQVKQTLGIAPRAFKHTDAPTPPDLRAVVVVAQLRSTAQLTVADGAAAPVTTDDPQRIDAVVDLLRTPLTTLPASATAAPTEPIKLRLTLHNPERMFELLYNPATNIVVVFNTPTAAWPEHIVGSYAVPPGFGPALQDALTGSVPVVRP